MSKEFEIKRSITEKDVPPVKSHSRSKYSPIIKSLQTLEVGEGIEVSVKNLGVQSGLVKLIKSRLPRRHYSIAGRTLKTGVHLYIIRKS